MKDTKERILTVAFDGQLANATSASGEVSFNIPTDIDGREYELRLFNEQINGDKKTDFSSDFKTVSLTEKTNTESK